MNTKFEIGQEVVAKFNQQGLVEGRLYRVVDMSVRYMRGLTYTTYVVCQGELPGRCSHLTVGNGHLILAAV